MDTQKRCASCAAEIAFEARKCPHCRSFQPGASRMYRDLDRRLIAGVCAGIAREVGMDPTLIRLAVALLGVASFGLAFWGYVVLWVITPASALGEPPLGRVTRRVREMFSSEPRGQPTATPEG